MSAIARRGHLFLNGRCERPSKIRPLLPYNPMNPRRPRRGTSIAKSPSQREAMPMMPNASRQVVLDEVKLERYRALLASTAIFRGCSAAAIDDLARRLQVRTRPA